MKNVGGNREGISKGEESERVRKKYAWAITIALLQSVRRPLRAAVRGGEDEIRARVNKGRWSGILG